MGEDVDCSQPFAGAKIRVRRACDQKVIRRVTSGEHGRFRVRLRPGRYVLDPVDGHPFPVARRQRVRVKKGEFTRVQITYDNGAD